MAQLIGRIIEAYLVFSALRNDSDQCNLMTREWAGLCCSLKLACVVQYQNSPELGWKPGSNTKYWKIGWVDNQLTPIQ